MFFICFSLLLLLDYWSTCLECTHSTEATGIHTAETRMDIHTTAILMEETQICKVTNKRVFIPFNVDFILGVFLHVLADTLGSVFVIISTLLIQWFGWQWTDPFCSLILSLLIVGSVYPLLKSSGAILLQSIPMEIEDEIDHILTDVFLFSFCKYILNPHV
jgi:divalent metal cation (Fe/Co/Zn/Cd) transporter